MQIWVLHLKSQFTHGVLLQLWSFRYLPSERMHVSMQGHEGILVNLMLRISCVTAGCTCNLLSMWVIVAMPSSWSLPHFREERAASSKMVDHADSVRSTRPILETCLNVEHAFTCRVGGCRW